MESLTSSSGREEPSENDADAFARVRPSIQKKAKRVNTNIVTSSFTGALDRVKVSKRKAVFLLTETLKALGKNIEEQKHKSIFHSSRASEAPCPNCQKIEKVV